MPLIGIKGQIKFLRVGDPTNVWGPPTDSMRSEVVVILDTKPDVAAGLELEAGDPALPSRLAMLSILRDAYNHKHEVGIAVNLPEGKKNGVLRRVEYA